MRFGDRLRWKRARSYVRVCRCAVGLVAVLALLGGAGCGGGFRPYRAMAKAATSEENVFAQVEDRELKMQIREALLADGLGVGVTPYVYMGHAYLVGSVETAAQRERALADARGVEGVRSVDGYLPVAPRASATKDVAAEAEVKAAIGLERDERMTRVEVKVVDGHAVLLGVVSSPDAIASVQQTAQQVSGVTGVTNFLLLPEPDYERFRPGLR